MKPKQKIYLAGIVILALICILVYVKKGKQGRPVLNDYQGLDVSTEIPEGIYHVESIIDGNTLKVKIGGKTEKVRLIGIDAPETRKNVKARQEAQRMEKDVATITQMGQESTKFVEQILMGRKEIKLEFDVAQRDQFGRLQAYAYTRLPLGVGVGFAPEVVTIDALTWMFINATIVKNGYATPQSNPPNTQYAELFQELHEEAKENKRGLYKKKKKRSNDRYVQFKRHVLKYHTETNKLSKEMDELVKRGMGNEFIALSDYVNEFKEKIDLLYVMIYMEELIDQDKMDKYTELVFSGYGNSRRGDHFSKRQAEDFGFKNPQAITYMKDFLKLVKEYYSFSN